MKKIIAIMLALLLIAAMAVPVAAVTPPLNTPSITVPDISDSVQANIDEQYDLEHAADSWLDEHPITIDSTEPTEEPTEAPTGEPTEEPTEAPTGEPTEVPTEPPEENEPACTDWHGWLSGWLRWWNNLIH